MKVPVIKHSINSLHFVLIQTLDLPFFLFEKYAILFFINGGYNLCYIKEQEQRAAVLL